MFAIDDFGRPSRRASSLGPRARPAPSARTSRIAAARVTAGASDSPLAPSCASLAGAVAMPVGPLVVVNLPCPASLPNGSQHLDSRDWVVYCPAHRRVFSMLDDGVVGQEEDHPWCRGSDRSRQRSLS